MVAESMDIKIRRKTESSINKLDWDNLAFGRVFSDHMFVMEYADGEWKNPEISEYADLRVGHLSSASLTLFSPNTLCPDLSAHSIAEGGCVLLTATNVMSLGFSEEFSALFFMVSRTFNKFFDISFVI